MMTSDRYVGDTDVDAVRVNATRSFPVCPLSPFLNTLTPVIIEMCRIHISARLMSLHIIVTCVGQSNMHMTFNTINHPNWQSIQLSLSKYIITRASWMRNCVYQIKRLRMEDMVTNRLN